MPERVIPSKSEEVKPPAREKRRRGEEAERQRGTEAKKRRGKEKRMVEEAKIGEAEKRRDGPRLWRRSL